MTGRNIQTIVISVVCIGLCTLMLIFLNQFSFSSRSEAQRVRIRLFRLGRAVNFWIDEHGRTRFPKITNPAPHTPWAPNRLGSTAEVLADYLGGDVVSTQRENESKDEWHTRLRERELTVDPATGFEFWYNPDLSTASPLKVAANDRLHMYFRCQTKPDRNWPYEESGVLGYYRVSGVGIQRQVSDQELSDLRMQLAKLQEDYKFLPREKQTIDLPAFAASVRALEIRFQGAETDDKGVRYITIKRLDCTVGFYDPSQ